MKATTSLCGGTPHLYSDLADLMGQKRQVTETTQPQHDLHSEEPPHDLRGEDVQCVQATAQRFGGGGPHLVGQALQDPGSHDQVAEQ